MRNHRQLMQNLVDMLRGASERGGNVRSVGHQASRGDPVAGKRTLKLTDPIAEVGLL